MAYPVHDRLRIDDSSEVDHGSEVLALVRACAASRTPCSVRPAGRPESYLSVVREIAEDGCAVLDPPRAPVIARALSPGSVASIALRLDDVRVHFDARVDRIARSGDTPRLHLRPPRSLIPLPPLDRYRVPVPIDLPVLLTLDPSAPTRSSWAMKTLGIHGGSLEVIGRREDFGVGAIFSRARLALPDGEAWAVVVRIIHEGVLRRHADRAEMRIGVQFVQSTARFEAALRRMVGGIVRHAPVRTRGD